MDNVKRINKNRIIYELDRLLRLTKITEKNNADIKDKKIIHQD
jgi:hypothetical protein